MRPAALLPRAALLIAAALASELALGCDGLQVTKGWIREAPPGADVMAAYAQLKNTGRESITIEGARSVDFGGIEMHRTQMEQGKMRMRAEPQVLLEPDATLTFEPGGLHLMLFAPKRALKAGDHVALKFDCGRKSTTGDFVVKADE